MASILYLEDESWQVESTVITFIEKELGHEVMLVRSVAEAKAQLSTTPFNVVFLDVMLDLDRGLIEFENSGLQIGKLILDGTFADAGNPTTLPTVIASGVWDATAVDKAGTRLTVEDWVLSLGLQRQCFLRKPFLVDEMREVLEWALSKE
jgi:hypothetical protein